jgi:hypothetical protein
MSEYDSSAVAAHNTLTQSQPLVDYYRWFSIIMFLI